jgi:ATP-dependent RNA helicase DOB1
VAQFHTHLVFITSLWLKGHSFPEVMKETDLFEGSVIRIFRRLEELLRQLVEASHAIGNSELEDKFTDGLKRLKRGIMFAGSLYL